MAAGLKDIVLSFSDAPSKEDIGRLLEAYRLDNPVMYDKWVEIETHPVTDERDALKEIQLHGLGYLRQVCANDDYMGAARAWARMRWELLNNLRDQGAFRR